MRGYGWKFGWRMESRCSHTHTHTHTHTLMENSDFFGKSSLFTVFFYFDSICQLTWSPSHACVREINFIDWFAKENNNNNKSNKSNSCSLLSGKNFVGEKWRNFFQVTKIIPDENFPDKVVFEILKILKRD